MELLEYQAKEWFHEIGIPVLPSQKINRPSDLKGLKIPYPIVLKSQVRVGGRGRAGGVRFVENTIDAIAAAQTIFHLPILGEFPEVVLAESKYDAQQEIYLAVVLEASAQRPVLLGSTQVGIDAELALEQMQQVVVQQEFSPFYARRLAVKMGLQADLIESVSTIVEKMYRLFVQKDLDLVEINPLGISSTGEVMALDGKVTVNDTAINRHPDVVAMAMRLSDKGELKKDCWGRALLEQPGRIGIVANGMGLMLATLDLVTQGGVEPGTCLDLEAISSFATETATSLSERLAKGLELLSQDKKLQVVLVNLLSSSELEQVAEAIVDFHQRHLGACPHLVIRLLGPELGSATERLAAVTLPIESSLDQAVAQAVRLAKKR